MQHQMNDYWLLMPHEPWKLDSSGLSTYDFISLENHPTKEPLNNVCALHMDPTTLDNPTSGPEGTSLTFFTSTWTTLQNMQGKNQPATPPTPSIKHLATTTNTPNWTM